MNQALMEARKKFKGQKVEMVTRGFDDSPIPEGKYVARIVESKIKEDDEGRPKHSIMLRIEEGDSKGRNVWPFAPYLDDLDGVTQSAQYVRTVRGDVIPCAQTPTGAMALKPDDYLAEAEELIHSLIGELVEIQIRNRGARADNKHLNNKTGQPFQNVYINRGMGEDKAGVKPEANTTREARTPASSMAVSRKKKIVTK